MQHEVDNFNQLENRIEDIIFKALNLLLPINKEWMSLAEGAKYAGVSHNTFMKFREMGLKVSQIDGIKRVSRKEIDHFLENYSF